MKQLLRLSLYLLWPFFFLPTYGKDLAFTIHSQKSTYHLKNDFSYECVEEIEYEILSREGIEILKQVSHTHHPGSEKFEPVYAYSLSPSGERTDLLPESIFTRTSHASENAPGFTSSLTTTFVFPNLQVGSRIFLCTRTHNYKPSFPGFSFHGKAPWACGARNLEVIFHLPSEKTFYCQWKAIGAFTVEDKTEGNKRIIKAQLRDFPSYDAEPSMVFPSDFPPSFTLTTFKNWSEIGIYYETGEQKALANVQPSQDPLHKPSASEKKRLGSSSLSPSSSENPLKKLSDEIVGSKRGKEAAQALYQWVCNQITYVALFLDWNDGFVPHTPQSILTKRYGDCKDKAILLKTLLECQNITAYTALISPKLEPEPPLPCESYFDHVILYLPELDVFVDPTQVYASFGEISPELMDHLVVLATPKGQVLRTPMPQALQNLYTAHAEMILDDKGNLKGNYTLETTGPSATGLRSYFSTPFTTPEEFARNILNLTPEGGTGKLSIKTNPRTLQEPLEIFGEWTTPGAFIAGEEGSIFFPLPYGPDLRLSLPFMRQYFTTSPRLFPFAAIAGIDTWTYTVSIPKDREVFTLPTNKSLSNQAGRYESSYHFAAQKIHVKRVFVLTKNIYTPADQNDFMDLIELMLLDLRQPIGIKKRS